MGGHTTGKLGKQCEDFWRLEKIFSHNSHPEITHRPKDDGKIIFECFPEWVTIHPHRAAEENKSSVKQSHRGIPVGRKKRMVHAERVRQWPHREIPEEENTFGACIYMHVHARHVQ